MSTWIVINPKAGSGRAAQLELLLRRELPEATIVETQGPGDGRRLAALARTRGASVVAAVGGDGTISECVAGLCLSDDGQRTHAPPSLALIASGTGGDFKRTFSITDSVAQAVTRLRSGTKRKLDVGQIRIADSEQVATFVNVLSFGLGGETTRIVERGPKWLGGRAAFFLGALQATVVHQPLPIELALDGEVIETAPYSNVAICNGQFFGGGMQICPEADPGDGFLDVVTMELSKVRTVSLTAHIYRGTHLSIPGVKHYRCRKLSARPTRDGVSLVEADGERLGQLPLEVEIWPGALDILC